MGEVEAGLRLGLGLWPGLRLGLGLGRARVWARVEGWAARRVGDGAGARWLPRHWVGGWARDEQWSGSGLAAHA